MNTEKMMRKCAYILFLIFPLLANVACQSGKSEPITVFNVPVELSSPLAQTLSRLKSAQILQVERPNGLESADVRFGTITFTQAIKANDAVTLVPLGVELPTLQTSVSAVTVTDNPCSESLPKIYDAELQPISETAWLKFPTPFSSEKRFSENAPFEICVLYPAVKQARALNRGLLQPAKLPRRVQLQNILVALDTTGDDIPDVLVVEYCCGKPEVDRHNCDLTCKNVYQRDSKGNWVIVDKQTPC